MSSTVSTHDWHLPELSTRTLITSTCSTFFNVFRHSPVILNFQSKDYGTSVKELRVLLTCYGVEREIVITCCVTSCFTPFIPCYRSGNPFRYVESLLPWYMDIVFWNPKLNFRHRNIWPQLLSWNIPKNLQWAVITSFAIEILLTRNSLAADILPTNYTTNILKTCLYKHVVVFTDNDYLIQKSFPVFKPAVTYTASSNTNTIILELTPGNHHKNKFPTAFSSFYGHHANRPQLTIILRHAKTGITQERDDNSPLLRCERNKT